ncbi:hypothetical protein P5V15_012051 [Pogonomyrmex californicus]
MIFWMSCLLYIVSPIETAKILAIVPIPSYSHQVAYRALWTSLSRRGHEVVLITTDPINDPSLTNLTEIDVHFTYKVLRKMDFVKTMDLSYMNVLYTQAWPACLEISEMVYKHPEVRKMYISGSNREFDVVIAETIKTPSFYALAHRFNAPLIGKTNDIYENVNLINISFILMKFRGRLDAFPI